MSELTELALQSKCYLWFHNTFPEKRGLLFHVNNKAKNEIEGNRFKAIGVVAGIPDLLFINNKKLYGIEMKTEKGKVSPDQKNIHNTWIKEGIEVIICRNLDQFQQIIYSIVNCPANSR